MQVVIDAKLPLMASFIQRGQVKHISINRNHDLLKISYYQNCHENIISLIKISFHPFSSIQILNALNEFKLCDTRKPIILTHDKASIEVSRSSTKKR